MQKPHTGELVFFWILFGAVGLLSFAVMSPYLTPLFLAAVLAILFAPLNRRMLCLLKRPGAAAFATITLVLIVIVLPLSLIGYLLFNEVIGIYTSMRGADGGLAFVDQTIAVVERLAQKIVPELTIDINVYQYLEAALRWIASNLNNFFSGILSFLFHLFLVVVAMFFFFRDGGKLREFAVKWSPLADSYDESILARVELAVATVMKETITTALVQGTLVGIGFAFFGVPNPVLWGTVAAVMAVIPVLGTGFVTIPAVAWLFYAGHPISAIFLAAWAFLIVGLVDNVMKPYLMTSGVGVHPFLILLSIFGGLAYFGPVGFLAGPVILSFFFTLLDIYPRVIKGRMIKEG